MDKAQISIVLLFVWAIGGYTLYLAINNTYHDYLLERYGEKVSIEPFSSYDELEYIGMGIVLTSSKTADIKFTTITGDHFFIKDKSIDNRSLKKMTAGEAVEIIYFPNNPLVNKLATYKTLKIEIVLYAFGVIFITVGFLLLVIIVKMLRK